jgi:hypothetical protein
MKRFALIGAAGYIAPRHINRAELRDSLTGAIITFDARDYALYLGGNNFVVLEGKI